MVAADPATELKALCAFEERSFQEGDRFNPENWLDYQVFWMWGEMGRIGLIAFEPNTECGEYGMAWKSQGCLWITSIAIAPEFQGKGFGAQLMRWAIEWAKTNRFSRISSNCRVSNAASVRLHEKVGFIEIRRTPGYYENPPEDAIVFELALKS